MTCALEVEGSLFLNLMRTYPSLSVLRQPRGIMYYQHKQLFSDLVDVGTRLFIHIYIILDGYNFGGAKIIR